MGLLFEKHLRERTIRVAGRLSRCRLRWQPVAEPLDVPLQADGGKLPRPFLVLLQTLVVGDVGGPVQPPGGGLRCQHRDCWRK